MNAMVALHKCRIWVQNRYQNHLTKSQRGMRSSVVNSPLEEGEGGRREKEGGGRRREEGEETGKHALLVKLQA
jgi:hypothetical protein